MNLLMKKQLKMQARVISLLLLSCVGLAGANEKIILEENGFLVFETETIDPVGDWEFSNKISGSTGTGYFRWTGPTLANVARAGEDALVYHFRIANAGNYELRWRSRIAQGNDNTEHNDSWVRFLTGSNVAGEQPINGWTKSYLNRLGAWAWQTTTVDHNPQAIRQFFSAGDHTIEISGRSTGHAIDRIVLFRYGDHEFNEESFNTAAVSSTSNGPVNLVEPVAPAPDPAPEPVTAAPTESPVSATVDTSNQTTIAVVNTGGSCSDGVASIGVIADVYTQAGSVINSADLRLETGNRTSFLLFDTSQVPDGYTSASLQFQVGTDEGDGTLSIYSGDHGDWSDRTAESADLPSATSLVGSDTGRWDKNMQHSIPLDTTLLRNGQISLLLVQENGGSDFSLKSSSTGSGPRLLFSSSDSNFCGNYETNQELANQTPEPESLSALESAAPESSGGGGVGGAFIWLLVILNIVRIKRTTLRYSRGA